MLESVSRVMKDIVPPDHYDQAGYIKNIMSVYRKARDLIDIGAYKSGSNAEIDEAIRLNPDITRFLRQSVDEPATYEETIGLLHQIGK